MMSVLCNLVVERKMGITRKSKAGKANRSPSGQGRRLGVDEQICLNRGGAAGRCNVFKSSRSLRLGDLSPLRRDKAPRPLPLGLISRRSLFLASPGFLLRTMAGQPPVSWSPKPRSSSFGDAFGAATRGSLPLHQLDVGNATPLNARIGVGAALRDQ